MMKLLNRFLVLCDSPLEALQTSAQTTKEVLQ